MAVISGELTGNILNNIAPFLLDNKFLEAQKEDGKIVTITIPKICDYYLSGNKKGNKQEYEIININPSLFCDSKVLEKIDISETKISKIEKDSFKNCTSLKEVVLPNILQQIGESAFEGCTSLKVLEIPDSVSVIGNSAFKGVESIIYNGNAEGSPWGADKVYKTIDEYNTEVEYLKQGTEAKEKSKEDRKKYQEQVKGQKQQEPKKQVEESKTEEKQESNVENILNEDKKIQGQKQIQQVQSKETFQKEIIQLKEDKKSENKGLFSMFSKNDKEELQSRIDSLEEEKKKLLSKIEELRNKVSYYQNLAQDKIKALEIELQDERDENKNLKYKNSDLENEKKDLKNIYLSLEKLYISSENKLNSYIEDPEVREKNFDEKLKYLFDTLVNKNKTLSDNEDLFDKFFVLFIEKDVLAEKQSVKEKIECVSKKIKALEKDKKELEENYKALEKDKKELEENYKDLEEKSKKYLDLARTRNSQATKIQQEFQQENDRLKQEKDVLEKRVQLVERNLAGTQEYKTKYEKIEKDFEAYKKDQEDKFEAKKKEQEEERKSFTDVLNIKEPVKLYEYGQKQLLEKELQDIKSEKENLSRENEKLNNELKEKDEIIRNANAQKIVDAGKIQNLQDYIKDLEEEQNKIVEAKDNSIETLRTEKGKLQGRLESTMEQIYDLKKRSEEDENKISELTKENGDLKGQLKAKKEEIENLKNTEQKYLENIESLNNDVENAKYEEGKINGLLQSERERKEQLDEEIKSLRKENTKLFSDKDIAVEREKELAKQKKDIEAKRDTLIEEKNNIKQKADDFEKKYKDKRDELDRVNDELKNINKELEKYKKQAGEAEKNLKFKEAEFEKINEAYADFDELSNAYNALSDAVKSECKLIFGASDNIVNIVFNIINRQKFENLWGYLFDKVNEGKISKEHIESLKKIFDISFKFICLTDKHFERLQTKNGDLFDYDTMDILKNVKSVKCVNEVLLLGYRRGNFTQKSLVK